MNAPAAAIAGAFAGLALGFANHADADGMLAALMGLVVTLLVERALFARRL